MGAGLLESVYQNALAHELRKAGIGVACERPLTVIYDGVVVGEFSADMMIEETVLVENKAVRVLAAAHEVQLVNYLNATGKNVGLLINFGGFSLEFKRKYRRYRPNSDEQNFGQD
ncbi:MAG: GxxExxY protein [Nibricoccus sp.]